MTIEKLWLAALTAALTEAEDAKRYDGNEGFAWANAARVLLTMTEQPGWYAVSQMTATAKAEG